MIVSRKLLCCLLSTALLLHGAAIVRADLHCADHPTVAETAPPQTGGGTHNHDAPQLTDMPVDGSDEPATHGCACGPDCGNGCAIQSAWQPGDTVLRLAFDSRHNEYNGRSARRFLPQVIPPVLRPPISLQV